MLVAVDRYTPDVKRMPFSQKLICAESAVASKSKSNLTGPPLPSVNVSLPAPLALWSTLNPVMRVLAVVTAPTPVERIAWISFTSYSFAFAAFCFVGLAFLGAGFCLLRSLPITSTYLMKQLLRMESLLCLLRRQLLGQPTHQKQHLEALPCHPEYHR